MTHCLYDCHMLTCQCCSDFMEDILSPDEGSCNSSRLSTKSEKNMADFEGEDVLSDDELAHINAHTAQTGHFSGHHHMQQHLANMASMYHKCLPQSEWVRFILK